MKAGSILLNAARGGIIDEAALILSLEAGHLHGAGLDVFAREPLPADDPLLEGIASAVMQTTLRVNGPGTVVMRPPCLVPG